MVPACFQRATVQPSAAAKAPFLAQGFFGPCEGGRQEIDKRTCFGGPCLEGTLQKPTHVSESGPVAGAIKGVYPYKTLDAGRARELQKCAQPATQMLSVHCLYQAMGKSARGNRFFRTKVYRDGTGFPSVLLIRFERTLFERLSGGLGNFEWPFKEEDPCYRYQNH